MVIISPDNISEKMAGPGIRYWNLAIELSKYFEVTLFTPNLTSFKSDFNIKKIVKYDLIESCREAVGVIIQGMTLWNYPYLKKTGVPIVVDLYDPFVLENLELFTNESDEEFQHRAALSVLIDQLKYGDYFICASEKQKDFWIGMLTVLNRVNPIEYKKDKTLEHLIGIVPFGLPSVSPIKNKQVLKGVYPGIKSEDKVIIWGGGIWDWLDPLTAIKSIKELSRKREDIKLFFMGTKHPNTSMVNMSMLQKSIELSSELNLSDKYVFFNDWVDYEDRHNYLLESDIGLNLHFNHLETRFSYRTRILDYIWCNLPTITTSGDVMSEIIKTNKLGKVVSSENIMELSEAIEEMLEDQDLIKKTFQQIANSLTWGRAVEPLISFLNKACKSEGKIKSFGVNGIIKSRYVYFALKALSLAKKDGLIPTIKKIIVKLKK